MVLHGAAITADVKFSGGLVAPAWEKEDGEGSFVFVVVEESVSLGVTGKASKFGCLVSLELSVEDVVKAHGRARSRRLRSRSRQVRQPMTGPQSGAQPHSTQARKVGKALRARSMWRRRYSRSGLVNGRELSPFTAALPAEAGGGPGRVESTPEVRQGSTLDPFAASIATRSTARPSIRAALRPEEVQSSHGVRLDGFSGGRDLWLVGGAVRRRKALRLEGLRQSPTRLGANVQAGSGRSSGRQC